MTAGCPQALRDLDHVRQVVAETCFPIEPTVPSPGRVGLEAETFPVQVLADGTPVGRVPLDHLVKLLDLHAGAGGTVGRSDPAAEPPRFPLPGGGSLTFEPGGQLEHSTTIHAGAAGALAELDLVAGDLAAALRRHGVLLAGAGADVWLPNGEVPQQLHAPRYAAMAAYFELRGPYGAAMMRRSCALQVNLDLGDPTAIPERWLVANLVAPLACATFAASPGPDAVSVRALAWQRLDPTRTGFPRRLVDDSSPDPVEQLTDAALAADVLLLRCPSGPWEPGRPGWSFGDWLRDGHPRHGRPSDDDLRYHLSTLFFEVRPRGFMELRAVDALPARLRAVPVVLLVGLLEDARSRTAALELLARHRCALPALARRAAADGLADAALASLAATVWTLALEGARRLAAEAGGGYLDPEHLALAEEFLERLTLRRRCPADDLRAALAAGPAAALAWATEPARPDMSVRFQMHPDHSTARSGAGAVDAATLRTDLARDLAAVRQRLDRLTEPLTDEVMHRQHDRIMSPLVWDVGHVGNFEELWLLRQVDDRRAHNPDLDSVYNPFENPRWVRAGLPILPRAEAAAYLAEVRAEALHVLRRVSFDPQRPLVADGYVYRMIVQHEAQHQETMLQTLDLRGSSDLTAKPYTPAAWRRLPTLARPVDDVERVVIPGGPFRMGTHDRTAAYDNERPSHVVEVPTFAIDRFPVTARRFGAFVAAGGYERPELWSEAGRAWLRESGERAPQGWVPDGMGGYLVRRFGHLEALDPREPVQHISFFEAEAFARWEGGRLPSEEEWEKAAVHDPASGRSRTYPWGEQAPDRQRANLDHAGWGPAPVGSFPAGASAYGVEQLLGDVYEWTSSPFTGYPGYSSFPYPEYSEVFFGDDYRVLRGASWATSGWVSRASFRNWDYPRRRQIFAGVRLAWDVA